MTSPIKNEHIDRNEELAADLDAAEKGEATITAISWQEGSGWTLGTTHSISSDNYSREYRLNQISVDYEEDERVVKMFWKPVGEAMFPEVCWTFPAHLAVWCCTTAIETLKAEAEAATEAA